MAETLPEDEVDAFSSAREFVNLDVHDDAHEQGSDEDQDVLALSLSSDDGDDDDRYEDEELAVDDDDGMVEDDDDDAVEDAQSEPKADRRARKIAKEEAISSAWGKKRFACVLLCASSSYSVPDNVFRSQGHLLRQRSRRL